MCTISYIPIPDKSNNSFIVTDNRDESVNRPADLPKIYHEYNALLFYPKDKRAGGTWIGASNHKTLICLMNGAFFRHQREASYRKSRGIVVKELLASGDPLSAIEGYTFNGIEPFFALLFLWEKNIAVYELIWDGLKAHVHKKDSRQSALWSAAMTYSKAERKNRKMKFDAFVKEHQNRQITPALIWDYHHSKSGEDNENMIINYGELRTTSISQFQHTGEGKDYFRFEDLISGEKQRDEIVWHA